MTMTAPKRRRIKATTMAMMVTEITMKTMAAIMTKMMTLKAAIETMITTLRATITTMVGLETMDVPLCFDASSTVVDEDLLLGPLLDYRDCTCGREPDVKLVVTFSVPTRKHRVSYWLCNRPGRCSRYFS